MNEALSLIQYLIQVFFKTIFECYLFPGVSLGMLFIVLAVFSILIRYVVAIPKYHLSNEARNTRMAKERYDIRNENQ